jgi:hypothetical protein
MGCHAVSIGASLLLADSDCEQSVTICHSPWFNIPEEQNLREFQNLQNVVS